jgi:hypothetical protein
MTATFRRDIALDPLVAPSFKSTHLLIPQSSDEGAEAGIPPRPPGAPLSTPLPVSVCRAPPHRLVDRVSC